MAARSFQIALGAGATRLSDVYIGLTAGLDGGPNTNIGGSAGVLNPRSDVPYRTIIFYASGAAAFLGGSDMAGTGSNPVSSANYGTKVDSAAGVPPLVVGAFDQGPMKLSDYWASGAGSTLHILAVPY